MPEARQLPAAEIARKEISSLLGLAEQAGVDDAGLCAALGWSQDDWQGWVGILQDAPLPARPALPLVLQQLGYVTSRLDRATRAAYV
jgi:hypothetical protein